MHAQITVVPEGICDCPSCQKFVALAAEPWTWDDDLALRELQRRRRTPPERGMGNPAAGGDTVGTSLAGGLL